MIRRGKRHPGLKAKVETQVNKAQKENKRESI